MGAIGAVVLFVIVPATIMLVIVSAVLGPRWTRAGRWRPGEAWHEEPIWIGPGDFRGSRVALPAATAEAVLEAGTVDQSALAAMDPQWQPGGARGQW